MLYFIAKLYFLLMIPNVIVSSNPILINNYILQQDLNSLSNWSTKSNLSFKSVHVSYNSKISTSYLINDSMINLKSHHKDLGIFVSDDLQWHLHMAGGTTQASQAMA